eukprot:TRINITY_DN2153_c0_g1_i10.p1 TRINITY_DN2153_c0_g1~~TRINITY_DN2153_c0_g1_i10.p1  ORF type:complete len:316 (+),score=48.35 TRINITY_DN2153_c0_g1_i10:174-1121(+)
MVVDNLKEYHALTKSLTENRTNIPQYMRKALILKEYTYIITGERLNAYSTMKKLRCNPLDVAEDTTKSMYISRCIANILQYYINHNQWSYDQTLNYWAFDNFQVHKFANLNEENAQLFDYFVVLDFEATCDNYRGFSPQEIIEFPSVLLDANTLEIVSEIQIYIKPVVHKVLTSFCTELTGIQQGWVENGITFKAAYNRYSSWLNDHGLLDEHSFAVITCGDWDLKTMLPNQCRLSNMAVPNIFKSWINIKRCFSEYYQTKMVGMANMLDQLNIKLMGRHHSGIDDCRNISKIAAHMIENKYIFYHTTPTHYIHS